MRQSGAGDLVMKSSNELLVFDENVIAVHFHFEPVEAAGAHRPSLEAAVGVERGFVAGAAKGAVGFGIDGAAEVGAIGVEGDHLVAAALEIDRADARAGVAGPGIGEVGQYSEAAGGAV